MHLFQRGILVLRMSMRNVLRHKRRSLLSGFAIAFAVIITLCLRGIVVNGSEAMVIEQLALSQHGALQIHKKGFTSNVRKSQLAFAFPVDAALMEKIRAVPGVVDAAARISFPAMVSVGDKTVPTPVIAIDPAHEYAVCPLKQNDVAVGKPLGIGGAVLTPQLKKQLTASEGTELTLLSQDSEGVMNAALSNTTGSLADIPLLTSSKKLLFVSLDTAQALLRLEGQATTIAVRTADIRSPEPVAQALAQMLGDAYEVQTWREISPMVVDSFAERRAILNYVTIVFLGIAMIGVLIAMLMSVLGRTREIGTMMAVGMRRKQIISLFMAEATVLGVLACIVGAIAGEAIVAFFAWKGIAITPPGGATPLLLRPHLELLYVLQIGGVVALATIVFASYPAYTAARLKPIVAMGAL
jgi:putative ABC transport system permease protein